MVGSLNGMNDGLLLTKYYEEMIQVFNIVRKKDGFKLQIIKHHSIFQLPFITVKSLIQLVILHMAFLNMLNSIEMLDRTSIQSIIQGYKVKFSLTKEPRTRFINQIHWRARNKEKNLYALKKELHHKTVEKI